MNKSKVLSKSNLKIPAGIRKLVENAPLLASENPNLYFDLVREIAEDVRPAGAIEWLWLKDIVYYIWEIQRFQVFKNQRIESERNSRAEEIAFSELDEAWRNHPDFDGFDPDRTYDGESIRKVTPKLDSDADSATAFYECIDTVEKIERLRMSAERRRDSILREIELRREIYARRLRDASEKIIDAKRPKALAAAE
jgi:hypothetical protein